MRSFLVYVSVLAALSGSYAVFQEKGNPYEDGSLKNLIKEVYLEAESTDGLESDTLILYPDKEDSFSVFFFIGGWSGTVPATVYHTLLTKIAAHGFIIVGPWPLSSDEPENVDVVDTALKWAQKNLKKYTGKATGDFSRLALGAHSAGANLLLELLDANKTTAQAFIGLEPFSAELESQVKFNVPGLFLGTELSEWSCAVPGLGFNNFYNNWKCPRSLVEVKGIGHCGVLDDIAWEVCDASQRCRTGEASLLPSYRQFVQGYASAFMMVHAQGSPGQYKYVTDRQLMPFELKQIKNDVNC